MALINRQELARLSQELELPPDDITKHDINAIGRHFIAVAMSPGIAVPDAVTTLRVMGMVNARHPGVRRRVTAVACERVLTAAVANSIDAVIAVLRGVRAGQHPWAGFTFADPNVALAVGEVLGVPEDVTEAALRRVWKEISKAAALGEMPDQTAMETLYLVRAIREGFFPVAGCIHPFTLVGLYRFSSVKEVATAFDNAVQTLVRSATAGARRMAI